MNTKNPRGIHTLTAPMNKVPYHERRSHFLLELTKLSRKYRMHLCQANMVEAMCLEDMNHWPDADIDAAFYTPHSSVYGTRCHDENEVEFMSPHYSREWARYFGHIQEEPLSHIDDTEAYAAAAEF